MLEIFRCKRKASNIEPLKAIIGNFYWGFCLTPQGNFLELTGGVEKLTGGFNPPTPPTIQSLRFFEKVAALPLPAGQIQRVRKVGSQTKEVKWLEAAWPNTRQLLR